MWVDAPFPRQKDAGSAVPRADPADLPIDQETIAKNRNNRIPYLEAREAVELEQKELKAVRETLGREIREICRPEIDEYIDCCVGRLFTVFQCKPHSLRMRRCMNKVETPEWVEQRTKEVMVERESTGSSLVNNAAKGTTRERRAMYNKAILPEVEDPAEMQIRKPKPNNDHRRKKDVPAPAPAPASDE
mmetsp:Transcript_35181/g.101096  ORF Transcript_35181/g.101096 Transcript_35181/m.101096 type:complete len:189 (-) Transcript_35181:47-613(-)